MPSSPVRFQRPCAVTAGPAATSATIALCCWINPYLAMRRRGGSRFTSSAVECSTRMDIPSALLCHLPLMWSKYDWESRSMQSHTLQ